MLRTLILALLIVTPVHAGETKKRPITLEDLWKVKRLGKPAISPDGKWVAVEVTTYSMDDNSSDSDIWLLSTDGKTQKQLTTYKGKESGPVWSPDGKEIAFTAKRGGDEAQIFLIAPDGGEARQLSKLPMSASGLKWGPDGKTIYCIVQTWPDTPDDASYKKKAKAMKDDKVKAHIIDDALYRYWDKWLADGKRPVVFAVDVATGKHKNLFAHTKRHLPLTSASADSYDISPWGNEICFTSDSAKELGTDTNLDLYRMPLDKPEEPKNITTGNLANDFNPVYSRKGGPMVFARQTTKFFYADRMRIMSYDGKVNDELTSGLDRSCHSFQFVQGPSERNLDLVFEAEDKGYHRLYMLHGLRLLKVDDKFDIIPVTSGFSDQAPAVSSNGEAVVFLRSSFDFPAQVHAFSTKERNPHRIDRFNDGLVAQWDLGKVDEVYFKGADDADVQMWVVYPPGFDAKKKWPLLQVIHGGPHNGITTDFHYRWNLHLFASKGYVVACVNFHGSSGFGQKFTDSITGDLANKPFIDIMKATDYLEKLPYIDKDRMAAAGASYGGYMIAWINGHTDRFKALICHAGVYNWHSMLASDIVRGRERALGTPPWGDLTKIDAQSPQRFAKNFKTPTLVMHGEKDYRVPVTQGFEFYNTLRQKGVPSRLVYFPDENHWILSPQNARLWHREFFAWLEKHVGAGPTK